ncbi:MAG: MATE family efflux transporter [Clostridia bacterium]|nr:MATE family efflux transporter [Clostridia bacterium]
MQARTRDMTQGSPLKLILFFALPIIAGNLFQQLYSLVDTLVVGRVEGVAALAAVSSAGWLDWMVLSLAIGLAQGFAIEIAQRFGAGDEPSLRRAAGQSMLLAAGITVVLMILSQISLRPLLGLLNTPQDTIDLTELYLRIIFAGIPLVMGFNLFGGFLRSVGDSRTPLTAMTSAALCNIALDIVFVAFFGWGVAGVAAATVISQGVSCLICLRAVARLPVMRVEKDDLKADPPVMARLLKLGLPVAFQNLIISVGGLVLQAVINGFGFLFMAGVNAATRMTGLLELAGTSIGSAMGTFAGQNLGAGKTDRIRQGLRVSAQIAFAIAVIMGVCVTVFSRPLLSLFVEDDPAVVEQVLLYGSRYLMVAGIGLPMLYLLFVYRSTLQGLGDTMIPMASGFMELVMRIACVVLLPMLIGEWGVYIAEIMAWIGAALLLIWGYYRRMKRIERFGRI